MHPRARQGFKLRKDFTCLGKKEGLTWNCHCIEISSLSHSLYLCSVCFLTWKKMNKSFTTCLSPSLSLCVLWGRRTWEYVQYEQHVQISDNIYIFVFTFKVFKVNFAVFLFLIDCWMKGNMLLPLGGDLVLQLQDVNSSIRLITIKNNKLALKQWVIIKNLTCLQTAVMLAAYNHTLTVILHPKTAGGGRWSCRLSSVLPSQATRWREGFPMGVWYALRQGLDVFVSPEEPLRVSHSVT